MLRIRIVCYYSCTESYDKYSISEPRLDEVFEQTFVKFALFGKINYIQGRSQDFSKGGAEVMEAKAL